MLWGSNRGAQAGIEPATGAWVTQRIGFAASGWSRAGARCQHLGWSVSPARSPNRTCGFHRIRLSTNPGDDQLAFIVSIHWSHGVGI